MCQPKDKGGRRCPMHQPASIGMKKFMVSQYGLEPGQVEHTFKRLRAEAGKSSYPTVEEYENFITKVKSRLKNSSVDDSNRKKIMRQLEKKLTVSELPDGATFYALKKLQARSRDQKVEFVQMIKEIAQHRGVSKRNALKQFREAYQNDKGTYERCLSDSFDTKTKAVASRLLDHDGVTSTGLPQFSPEPRIVRRPVPNSRVIISAGYDPDDGRLEVETAAGVHVFKNVPQDLATRITEQGRTRLLNTQLLNNPLYAYESTEQSARDAYGRYCEDCHKYKAISGHICEQGVRRGNRKSYEESLAKLRAEVSKDSNIVETMTPLRPKKGKTIDKFDIPREQRESVEVPSTSKTFARGRDLCLPTVSKLKPILEEGKVATFTITESFLESEPATLSMSVQAYKVGKHRILFDKGAAECDCAAYRKNKMCKHLIGIHEQDKSLSDFSNYELEYLKESANRSFAIAINRLHYNLDSESYNISESMTKAVDKEGNVEVRRFPTKKGSYNNGEAYSSAVPIDSTLMEIRKELDAGQKVILTFSGNAIEKDAQSSSEYTQVAVVLKADDDNYVIDSVPRFYCSICNIDHNDPSNCPHKDKVARLALNAVQETLLSGKEDLINIDATSRLDKLSEALNNSWVQSKEQSEEMSKFSIPGVDHSYTANLDQYIADVREAEKKAKNGENPLPFVLENATNGICAIGTARYFGVELEYSLPDTADKEEVMDKIAKDLHDAGLSDIDRATGYHEYDGNRWHIEEDCSVSGEVVSPMLSDTPEDWEQLQKVCEIIKKHGGKADVHTGGHVHMGLGVGTFEEMERRKVAATQIYAAYEDTLRRVQTNPERKKHRNSEYCTPISNTGATQDLIYELRAGGWDIEEDHYSAWNLGHQGRIEFRGADGSLDPAHIQAQVMVAASIVKAAERYEIDNVSPESRVGSNARKMKLLTRGKRTKPQTDDELIVADVELRKFADDILGTDHGRKVMAGIAASVPWQELDD